MFSTISRLCMMMHTLVNRKKGYLITSAYKLHNIKSFRNALWNWIPFYSDLIWFKYFQKFSENLMWCFFGTTIQSILLTKHLLYSFTRGGSSANHRASAPLLKFFKGFILKIFATLKICILFYTLTTKALGMCEGASKQSKDLF